MEWGIVIDFFVILAVGSFLALTVALILLPALFFIPPSLDATLSIVMAGELKRRGAFELRKTTPVYDELLAEVLSRSEKPDDSVVPRVLAFLAGRTVPTEKIEYWSTIVDRYSASLVSEIGNAMAAVVKIDEVEKMWRRRCWRLKTRLYLLGLKKWFAPMCLSALKRGIHVIGIAALLGAIVEVIRLSVIMWLDGDAFEGIGIAAVYVTVTAVPVWAIGEIRLAAGWVTPGLDKKARAVSITAALVVLLQLGLLYFGIVPVPLPVPIDPDGIIPGWYLPAAWILLAATIPWLVRNSRRLFRIWRDKSLSHETRFSSLSIGMGLIVFTIACAAALVFYMAGAPAFQAGMIPYSVLVLSVLLSAVADAVGRRLDFQVERASLSEAGVELNAVRPSIGHIIVIFLCLAIGVALDGVTVFSPIPDIAALILLVAAIGIGVRFVIHRRRYVRAVRSAYKDSVTCHTPIR